MASPHWTKDAYDNSLTSRCWWFTPYGAGWDESHRYGADMRADEELRAIVEMERALEGVPDWAQRIVGTWINFLPPCGHYLFPLAYLEAVSAIGSEAPPAFIHGCYAVERARKERMQDCLLCMDAWLAGAGPEVAAREVTGRAQSQAHWLTVCADLWRVLGEPTEVKALLVERILHRQRWWLKSMVWEDDARDVFCRDEYLGDIHCEGDRYGNPDFGDPYLGESASPRVQQLENRLARICPDWERFLTLIHQSWLCAPKAFRFLERLLWQVGREAAGAAASPSAGGIPGFLQCDDTYPDSDETAQWWHSFVAGLRAWWQADPRSDAVAADVNERLGEPTPVKRWLVRLLLRKLELYEREQLAKLVHAEPGTRRGTARFAQ